MNLVVLLLSGSCTFDEGFSQCDYQQDPYDDFDWTHINTQEVPYVSPDLPQGESLSFESFELFICELLIQLFFSPLQHVTKIKCTFDSTTFHSYSTICT